MSRRAQPIVTPVAEIAPATRAASRQVDRAGRPVARLQSRAERRGHAVLVGGQVNPVAKTAELRDHAFMEAAHEARFGKALEITWRRSQSFFRWRSSSAGACSRCSFAARGRSS